MRFIVLFLLVSTAGHAYVDIRPSEGVTGGSECTHSISDRTKQYGFGFFTSDEEDPEDPFLTPPEQPQYCLDNITEFQEIPLEDWERQVISYIVTEMAEKNVFQLLLEKADMERKGRKINHVHPLRFIGHVCNDPKLKKAMKVIKKNLFKWDSFINGFSRRVKEETERGNIFRFLPSFSQYLNVNEEEVTAYLRAGDSDGLVRFLISI
ncbi:MAG: hypothetical protein ACHQT8_00575 [Chlamydiales bacterium]